jgi:hypothetical protein
LYDLYHASTIKKCENFYPWSHNAENMDHLPSTTFYWYALKFEHPNYGKVKIVRVRNDFS